VVYLQDLQRWNRLYEYDAENMAYRALDKAQFQSVSPSGVGLMVGGRLTGSYDQEGKRFVIIKDRAFDARDENLRVNYIRLPFVEVLMFQKKSGAAVVVRNAQGGLSGSFRDPTYDGLDRESRYPLASIKRWHETRS